MGLLALAPGAALELAPELALDPGVVVVVADVELELGVEFEFWVELVSDAASELDVVLA